MTSEADGGQREPKFRDREDWLSYELEKAQRDLRQNFDRLLERRSRRDAKEAVLLVHTAGQEGQEPMRSFTGGYFDFGNFIPGTILRFKHLNDMGDNLYTWYVVGNSGKKPIVYAIGTRYGRTHYQLLCSYQLELEPTWDLIRVLVPPLSTAFFVNEAWDRLLPSKMRHLPAKYADHEAEFRKSHPELVMHTDRIDLISGGLAKKQKAAQSNRVLSRLQLSPQTVNI